MLVDFEVPSRYLSVRVDLEWGALAQLVVMPMHMLALALFDFTSRFRGLAVS